MPGLRPLAGHALATSSKGQVRGCRLSQGLDPSLSNPHSTHRLMRGVTQVQQGRGRPLLLLLLPGTLSPASSCLGRGMACCHLQRPEGAVERRPPSTAVQAPALLLLHLQRVRGQVNGACVLHPTWAALHASAICLSVSTVGRVRTQQQNA